MKSNGQITPLTLHIGEYTYPFLPAVIDPRFQKQLPGCCASNG
jgi:hypothetical protein